MKTRMTTIALTLFLVISVISTSIYAASGSTSDKPQYTNESIESLKMGVKNDNDGVRKCCIYFAGKYKISELKDELIDQISKEENPRIRILIALSLYQLENSDGIELLKIFALNDKDQEVRRMCTAIYNEYWKNSFQKGIKLSVLDNE